MRTTREEPKETKARLLLMDLKAGGWRLSKQQYMTCKGWILAYQFENAERFMLQHGLLVGGDSV